MMEKLGIGYRITLGLIIISLLTATLSIILYYNLTNRAFDNYIKQIRIQKGWEITQVLGDAYTSMGWEGIKAFIESANFMGRGHKMMQGRTGHNRGMEMPMMSIINNDITVTDLDGNIMASSISPRGQKLTQTLWDLRVPIIAAGDHIGYVIVCTPVSEDHKTLESAFSKTIYKYSYIVALFGITIALLAGFLISRNLQRPIKDLSRAVRLFTKGKRDIRIPVTNNDELGILALDFNTMADKINKSEELRKNLTADIAHELRTPLFILRGTLESIQRGILKPTPDVLLSLQDETIRMSRLIKDLSDLSRAEAGSLELNFQKISPSQLKDRFLHFETEAKLKGIDFVVDIPENIQQVCVDIDRLLQVIYNLLNNALHHTTTGKIKLSVINRPEGVEFAVADTGKGIKKEHIPYVFERFNREEKSRSRKTGGMGLGLSISKGIVEAHGGEIWVKSEEGRGSTFGFFLPNNERKASSK